MASPTLSQAVIKRSSDTELMPPPPPAKRIKRPAQVIDEDTYTDALSHIIARDFFPGLLETQTQQEYLDALDSKDRVWITSAGQRLSQIMTPGGGRRGVSMTPRPGPSRPGDTPRDTPRGWGGDTPMSVASAATSASASQSQEPDGSHVSGMSLGAFQAKYTSEDNESFNALLDKQNSKRRNRYAWMWNENKIPTARQIAHRQREAKRIEGLGDAGKRNQDRQLMLTSDLDARPAKPDGWKTQPENSLMFTPASVEDTHETVQQRSEARSRAGPKQVAYDNTRLQPIQSTEEPPIPPSPSISAIHDAIAGRPRPTDSEPGYTGGETPRVNGYAFVDEDEPEAEPAAAADGSTAEYDLRLLGAGDATPNPFKIRENRKREDLHHRMVEKVARNKRTEKIARETKTPVPRFPSSPMVGVGGARTPAGQTPGAKAVAKAELTPAAQRLWAQVGRTPRPGPASMARDSKIWTPTPRRQK